MSTLPNGTPIAKDVNFSVRAPYDPHSADEGAHQGGGVRADAFQVPSWSNKLSTKNGLLQARTNVNGERFILSFVLDDFQLTSSRSSSHCWHTTILWNKLKAATECSRLYTLSHHQQRQQQSIFLLYGWNNGSHNSSWC